ncbi:(-)-germacrene D synthase-like [Senna tora]|uniref:(-)-germacrene D synthase-like n=1 Tax=Senna tora TaxID=362788 RepID=A0A834TK95_9FABA|nr:(-)-germacrene D synthase-like [Senna tora]
MPLLRWAWGVNYHFHWEIDDVLQQIHNSYVENGIIILEEEDLHSLALLFRLLRQQGYRISSDVFEKFKDEKGNISESLSSDVEGMLSLYEAAHLRIHGEQILDEALQFTCYHLQLMTSQLTPSLAAKVNHSLRRPLHKSLPRLEASHYISIYQKDPSHHKTLLAFAKLDFNMLQKLHQKELGSISMLMTKVICIASILDDIYDVYGTFEELQLSTKAIDRWDINCMESLPVYMRHCYQALLDVYEEIEKEMIKQGRSFCVNYAKHEMNRLTQAYFEEAKWLNSNYTPTFEEYMGNAQISSGYHMLIATSFIGMGGIANEEAFHL